VKRARRPTLLTKSLLGSAAWLGLCTTPAGAQLHHGLTPTPLPLRPPIAATRPQPGHDLSATQPHRPHPPAARHVILVSIDALKAEYYTQADRFGLRIPTLRTIMRQGCWAAGARPVFPAVTYPSHTSLVTGVNPLHHGIGTNSVPDLDGKHPGEWHWYAQDIAAPTLWELAHRAGQSCAAISWPVTVGADIDYLVPEYVRYGLPYDLKLLGALSWPRGLLAQVQGAPGADPLCRDPDALIEQAARSIVRRYRPNLTLVHFVDLDTAQHEYGPDTPQALAALERLDERLGRLWSTAQAADPAVTLMVVSDHGSAPVTTTAYPNTLLAQAGLGKLARFVAAGGYAALYTAPQATAAERLRLQALVSTWPRLHAPTYAAVLDRAALDRLEGFPGACCAVVAGPGVAFASSQAATPTSAPLERGAHGYDTQRPDQQAALLTVGGGIRQGVQLPQVQVLDVAPTVAQLLGLPTQGTRMQGRVLYELLTLPPPGGRPTRRARAR
jgi:predicted AlkP superfamily pyrophosphatase or phosphodiesterase